MSTWRPQRSIIGPSKTLNQRPSDVHGYFILIFFCRDAAWEENNAFQDLLEQYNKCDSVSCQCPYGKSFSQDEGLVCRLL